MTRLRLFNVSEYVHAGARSSATFSGSLMQKPNGSWSVCNLPVGGIAYTLNAVIECLNQYPKDVLVFCIDDVPKIKNDIYYKYFGNHTSYKGTRRTKTPDIFIQRKMIKDVLDAIGVNCIKATGYEADDIIATLAHMYKGVYDEVVIHTVDSDLYSLVQKGVSIAPVGNLGRIVNMDNFEYSARKGKHTVYNTILLNKLFEGDKSDNIPAIPSHLIPKVNTLITPDRYELLVNPNMFRKMVMTATNNDMQAKGTVELLIPLTVPEKYLELHNDYPNVDILYQIGKNVQNKYICNKKYRPTICNIPGLWGTSKTDLTYVDDLFEEYVKEYSALIE